MIGLCCIFYKLHTRTVVVISGLLDFDIIRLCFKSELTFPDHLQNRTTPSLNETVYLSAVKENAVPDNTQYNTSVLNNGKEASKKIPKIPLIRSYLYGNMGNSSVLPMNSLAEMIIKPLLSLDKRNEIDNSTDMMTPNIVRKRTFEASNERIVTSPSATEDSAAKVASTYDGVLFRRKSDRPLCYMNH
ncbi:hypothetical protein Tsp_08723 [Trichinella spiralis]|uniref:hypothetical protein n=1 Tax=Trichinella spiralis TaxID=6334 RepID=UPI0001EFE133|nr:hypothetical protein Tsp_08723 [Trichinella spiralis]